MNPHTETEGRWLFVPSRAVMFARASTTFMTVMWAGILVGICQGSSPWPIRVGLVALALGYFSASTGFSKPPAPGKSIEIPHENQP